MVQADHDGTVIGRIDSLFHDRRTEEDIKLGEGT
jgi:hypothetical protein